MKVREKPAHEIRIAAAKGHKGAQKELARRKLNRRGMFEPDWEKTNGAARQG